jgi:prophage regulatory protein
MSKTKIIRRLEVETMTGLKRSSIYAKMAEGIFPKSINLGTRAVGWIESEVQDWLKNRIAESRKGGEQ